VAEEGVSVVIPTLNSAESLDKCLESIEAESHPRLEVIVVDGGSIDATLQVAASHRCMILPGSYRRSTARRMGANHATARNLLFLDADQTVELGLLSECTRLTSVGGLDAVKIPEIDSGKGLWFGCRELDRFLTDENDLGYPRFMTKDAYSRAGGHAEGLEDYLEDRELYLRLKESGSSIGWSRSKITNHLGRVNPVKLGIKGLRSASDSGVYFFLAHRTRDHPWSLVRPRLIKLAETGPMLRRRFPMIFLLPLYLAIVHGPRLMATVAGYAVASIRIRMGRR
jgi:glycosyltransferase involved in cell wall biosynthesis